MCTPSAYSGGGTARHLLLEKGAPPNTASRPKCNPNANTAPRLQPQVVCVRTGHEGVRQVGLQVAEVERLRLGHLVRARVGLRVRVEVRVSVGVKVSVGVGVRVRVGVTVIRVRVIRVTVRMGLGLP